MCPHLQVEPRFYLKSLLLILIIQINEHFLFHYRFENLMSNKREGTPLLSPPSLFLCFSHWVGPAKPLEVYSGELHSVRAQTWCSLPHFTQQIWHKKKYTWNFTPVELKCINIKAYAKPSWNSYQPIPAEQQLNKFLPATTEIWDFLPVTLFHKGITQAGSKMSGQHPRQSVKLVLCSSEILIK